MKILITGYRGFIGGHLYKHLTRDHLVIGIDKLDGNDLADPHIELPDADLIFHLAAQTSVMKSIEDPLLDIRDNILATMTLIRRYPDARIIYTGSAGASEQREIASPYGISKKAAGQYLKMLHKDYVICNLPNVFGVGGKGVVERFLSEDKVTVYGDGEQTRDFVHVNDVCDGLSRARSWPIGEYSLGSGIPVKIISLARSTGKEIVFEPARPGELLYSEVLNTTPNWSPKVDLKMYLFRREGITLIPDIPGIL